MQKTFKNQQGREFLLLELPRDDVKVYVHKANILPYGLVTIRDNNGVWIDELDIPTGNYQIICLAKDATEEQSAMVVDNVGNCLMILGDAFEDYKDEEMIYETAKESLTSLLTSLGFKQDDNVLIIEKI